VKILLNGLGRVGRSILKIAMEKENIEIVVINELN
jgi:glyceraldehyde-3-phosphate dehydrogenase/erythrose-4-phosphate dehydrogenase